MPSIARGSFASATVVGTCLALLTGVAVAQQGPVAAMFADDQKRHASLALSFLTLDVPATGAAPAPLRVYLSAGDLERAFDRADFRPDAAIVPTNTDLRLSAPAPRRGRRKPRIGPAPSRSGRRFARAWPARRPPPVILQGSCTGILNIP